MAVVVTPPGVVIGAQAVIRAKAVIPTQAVIPPNAVIQAQVAVRPTAVIPAQAVIHACAVRLSSCWAFSLAAPRQSLPGVGSHWGGLR